MTNYTYCSNFKKYMIDFLEVKRSAGYEYISAELILRRFDRFCFSKFPSETVLSEEIACTWATKKESEALETFKNKVTLIRQFAKYIISTGNYAYVVPKSFIPRIPEHCSYIYTSDDLKRFFSTVDNKNYKSRFKYTYYTLPVLFRVLYCCGLRISEVLNLKVKDVDLENGILSIYKTKNNNDRLVPINEFLTTLCKEYSEKMHKYSTDNNPFFYNKQYDLKFSYQTLEDLFQQIINNSNITNSKDHNGARIHAFRHTFAINCFNKWILENKDLSAYQAFLKTYMGHSSFDETTYYLKLTKSMFQNITDKSEVYLKDAIPSIGGDWSEK